MFIEFYKTWDIIWKVDKISNPDKNCFLKTLMFSLKNSSFNFIKSQWKLLKWKLENWENDFHPD